MSWCVNNEETFHVSHYGNPAVVVIKCMILCGIIAICHLTVA